MADADLLADYTRLVEVDGEFHLQVAILEWEGAHTPSLVWRTHRRWKRPPTLGRLAAAQQIALTDTRFFRVCEMCGERNNRGHMSDRHVCQACAATGLVF